MGPTLLLPLLACKKQDATVEPSELVGQVAIVTWTTDEPGRASVGYGLDDPDEFETVPTGVDTKHRVAVVGLKAGRTYTLEPRTELSTGETVTLDPVSFESAEAPDGLPVPQVVGTRDGYVLLGLDTGEMSWPVVIDGDGDYVWIGPTEARRDVLHPQVGAEFGTFVYDQTETDQNLGDVVRIAVDGSREERIRTDQMHHDFVELPDGTIGYVDLDIRPADVDGKHYDQVAGDSVREAAVDVPSSEVFSDWDVLDVSRPCEHFNLLVFGGLANDWTHSNSVRYLESGDLYLVMTRNLNAILAVDRNSGELSWQMGGTVGNDFEMLGDGLWWDHAHFSYVSDDELWLFDNGYHREPPRSSIVGYRYDVSARTIEEIWRSWGPQFSFVTKMGDVEPLANGHVLSSWTNDGTLYEMDENGTVVWQWAVALSDTLRAHHLDSIAY